MQIRVVEDGNIGEAGAAGVQLGDMLVIAIDPELPAEERYRLLVEILEQ